MVKPYVSTFPMGMFPYVSIVFCLWKNLSTFDKSVLDMARARMEPRVRKQQNNELETMASPVLSG